MAILAMIPTGRLVRDELITRARKGLPWETEDAGRSSHCMSNMSRKEASLCED